MSNDDFLKLNLLNLKDYNKYIENWTNNTIQKIDYDGKYYGVSVSPNVLDNLNPCNYKRFIDFMKNNLNNLDNNILENLQYSYYDNFVKYDGHSIGSDELVKFTPNNCKCKNGLKCDFNNRDCKSSVCPFKIRNLKENKIQSIKDEQINKEINKSRFIRKDIMKICISIIENSGFATIQYNNKHLKVKEFYLDIQRPSLRFKIDKNEFKYSIGDTVMNLKFEYNGNTYVLTNGEIVAKMNCSLRDDEKYLHVGILFKSLDICY